MVKCVAVGCVSGYKRKKNPVEKVFFYYVPKDEKTIKKWQIAILRDDITLKAGDAVCEKHFRKTDFIFERPITSSDGTVIGKTVLKKPELKKDVLPSLNLGRKEKPEAKPRSLFLKRTRDRNIVDEPKGSKTIKISEDKIREVSEKSAVDASDATINVDEDEVLPEENKTLFQQIAEDEKSVVLPCGWLRSNITCNHENGISFVKLIGIKEKNGQIHSGCHKTVTLDEDMNIFIYINGRHMENVNFGFSSNKFESVENLSHVLETVDKCQICQGSFNIENNVINASLLQSFTFIDGINILRNKCCPIILQEGLKLKGRHNQCNYCKNVGHVLNTKIIRRQRNRNSKYFLSKDLSPKKRAQLEKIKKIVKNTGRVKERAQATIRLLKATVKESQEKLSKTSDDCVDKMLSENSNISPNEQLAIKEILKASKVKSAKGRRYSDDWIILCLLLHMRSPVTYRMIYDNKILSVPCVRTIRRYLA
ncbi:uncharacterized protein LOC127287300 [Leptopilina boulardi]|uniref:uncharacterized protein LOC127287300 n=1 Tax=Leptopilina boulardi TaxID=63433 RepID=UPI0021F503DC|nr:uncharacterized protein LOC127287300 [Leptopilina boulardi]